MLYYTQCIATELSGNQPNSPLEPAPVLPQPNSLAASTFIYLRVLPENSFGFNKKLFPLLPHKVM